MIVPSKDLSNSERLSFYSTSLIRQEEQSASTVVSLNDCIQVLFHPIHRHLILIIYPREILIFDLQILQTVGSILCEKTSAAFYKVCCHRILARKTWFISLFFARSMRVRDVTSSYASMKVERSVFEVGI